VIVSVVGVALELGVIEEGLNMHMPEEDGEKEHAKLIWLVYEPMGDTLKA
jgi:hypothetical protein